MDSPNADQRDYWSASPSGAKWLTYEDQLDAVLAPVLDLVIARSEIGPGDKVLDIGCGTGASLLAAARAVGSAGDVLGVDISAPFLDRAGQRARAAGPGRISVLNADAQVHAFAPGARDALISRFGVMFFSDPQAAFANMARALRPGGSMTFAAWSGMTNNPWFRVPFEAAAARLGRPPAADPDAPGPMAFQDSPRVMDLMRRAGLDKVSCEVVTVALTPAGGADDVAALCLRVGPAARLMAEFGGSAADAQAIEADILARFSELDRDGRITVPAEINLFRARAQQD